nr:hypothetical protein [uncultured Flavobacterium sp.]
MKRILLKGALLSALTFGVLTMNSCKDKTAEKEANEATADSLDAVGLSSKPVADTIVRENDTIVSTKDAADKTINPAKDQVP